MKYRQLIFWATVVHSVLQQRHLPYYYALGFPKSGTGWVSRLLVDYLGVPSFGLKRRRWPALSPCVIKTHRFLTGRHVRRRTLYVVRDPRDVTVSYYWHVLRHGGAAKRDIESRMDIAMTTENLQANLPALIEYMQTGRCGAVRYAEHVARAMTDGYTVVKYEDLLTDCYGTLERAFSRMLDGQVDRERLQSTVSRLTFEAETGRSRGVAAPDNYIRKGVAGDWRNYFSDEAAQVLDLHCGDMLVELGYEQDRTWVTRSAA